MAEYIDRNKAIEIADHAYDEWCKAMAGAENNREINLCYSRQQLCKAVKGVIERVPVEDVSPTIHAHWVKCISIKGKKLYYYCSKCQKMIAVNKEDKEKLQELYPYCKCGAKMDKEVE